MKKVFGLTNKVIILSLLATISMAMKPEEYRFAVLIQDSVPVFVETPEVDFSMKQFASQYNFAETIDTLFIGDTVVVYELRDGLDYDVFAHIAYARYDTIIKKKSCCEREMDTILKLRIDEGWIWERWRDLWFIEYIEKEVPMRNNDRDGVREE